MDKAKSESEDAGTRVDTVAMLRLSNTAKKPEKIPQSDDDDLDDLDGLVKYQSCQRVSVDLYFRQISLMILPLQTRVHRIMTLRQVYQSIPETVAKERLQKNSASSCRSKWQHC